MRQRGFQPPDWEFGSWRLLNPVKTKGFAQGVSEGQIRFGAGPSNGCRHGPMGGAKFSAIVRIVLIAPVTLNTSRVLS